MEVGEEVVGREEEGRGRSSIPRVGVLPVMAMTGVRGERWKSAMARWTVVWTISRLGEGSSSQIALPPSSSDIALLCDVTRNDVTHNDVTHNDVTRNDVTR